MYNQVTLTSAIIHCLMLKEQRQKHQETELVYRANFSDIIESTQEEYQGDCVLPTRILED